MRNVFMTFLTGMETAIGAWLTWRALLVYDLPNRDGNQWGGVWGGAGFSFMTFLTGMETPCNLPCQPQMHAFMTFLTGMETQGPWAPQRENRGL